MRYELTKDLETGHTMIDSEHRQLFQAVNQLLDACAQGKGRSQLEPTLDFLGSYVNQHFGDEERLQIQTSYPGYSGHKQFHEGYKRELANVIREIKAQGSTIAALSRINLLVGQLMTHIRMEDKRLAQHVKQFR